MIFLQGALAVNIILEQDKSKYIHTRSLTFSTEVKIAHKHVLADLACCRYGIGR